MRLRRKSEGSLAESRDAALIFLYRLLFVLYAEDRGLLPVNDARYDDYGLRKPVRDEIGRRMVDEDTYSAIATNYYDHLTTLFKLIDKGDESIGLPPYNGGLFAAEAAPLLEKVRLADKEVAPIIYDLSHAEDSQGVRRFVNYRDMSVQQLGSIYERLLEREPVRDDGNISIRPNPYARKDSGTGQLHYKWPCDKSLARYLLSQPALSRLVCMPALVVLSCWSRLSAMWRITAIFSGPCPRRMRA